MLYLFCGKMGAGKSTLAQEIAETKGAILFSEDEWLAALYPGEIKSLKDYKRLSDRLRPQIKQVAQSVLNKHCCVTLDFPANTIEQRAWLKAISDEIGIDHTLFFLDQSDEICLQNIEKRVAKQPDRKSTDTPEMFHLVTQYFQAPSASEGLTIEKLK